MSDLHPDLIEPWSYPIPHIIEHAQVWHARRFATWLLSAGAEPRLGSLLSSGPKAIARWIMLLEEQGVEIEGVKSTLDRPLPAPLTQHRGTHFNRKLFLVENLDAITLDSTLEEREEHWRTLEGQRGQLEQTATWVVLLVTAPQTIDDMSKWAPRLTGSIERVCWVWEPSERSISTPLKRVSPHVKHHLMYQLFCAASASSTPIDHFTLGRIFRCGYPKPPRPAHERWKWGYRLWRGEARDPVATRFGQVGVTEPLKADVSPDDALWALRGRAEAASPARYAQWLERARGSKGAWVNNTECSLSSDLFYEDDTRDDIAEYVELDEHILALESLRVWALDSSPLAPPSLTKINEAELLINSSLCSDTQLIFLRAKATEWLTHAFAAHEDIEGCIRVNQTLYRDQEVWPEARFVAAERSLDLALFIQDHAEARLLVEFLARLDLELASPHYAARYLHAKAKQLGALDPSRGVWETEEASRLEHHFGLISPL